MKLIKIEQLIESKFLSFYKLVLKTKNNKDKDYYMATRRKREELACLNKNRIKADGVMILPITVDGEVVVLRQYRPVIDDYIYELPAGIVDEGETMEEAAIREVKEETGLEVISIEEIMKPSYSSVGISDETTGIMKAIVQGEISTENLEETEEIEVIKLKQEEVFNFVKSNNFSLKGGLLLLMMFKE